MKTDLITGTQYAQEVLRRSDGSLARISIGDYTYITRQGNDLVFDNDFVRMHTLMGKKGMLREVSALGHCWLEQYAWDDVDLPVNVDGMLIERDTQGRVIKCVGHGELWEYVYNGAHLTRINGPWGERHIIRDATSRSKGRPVCVTQKYGTQTIAYDVDGARTDLPSQPASWQRDEHGRLRAIITGNGGIEAIFLWDGFNCLARINGPPGSPLTEVYCLDLTSTPVRVITRKEAASEVRVLPRDAFGENLRNDGNAIGLFGGAQYKGFVWYRSRILDPITGSFCKPDPFDGSKEDPRRRPANIRANIGASRGGYKGPLCVEKPTAGPYAVCQYDPVTFMDPTGEIAWYYMLSTLTWAFPNNIFSWIGLEATANFWGTFFTGSWGAWADAEHWHSDRQDIGAIQRESFFAPSPGGAFTTQHIIWARHAYVDSKRRVSVFDPQGTFQPTYYGTVLRVTPSDGSAFLIAGQKSIRTVTVSSVSLIWTRCGGTAEAVAPGIRVPIFPKGGFHFGFVNNLFGPQAGTVTELEPADSIGLATLDATPSITLPAGDPALSPGDLVLLADGSSNVDIIEVAAVLPEGATRTIRFVGPIGFSATSNISLRKLSASTWTETLSNNGMASTDRLNGAATTQPYSIGDALRLTAAGSTFDGQLDRFETRVTIEASLPPSSATPLTIFTTAISGSVLVSLRTANDNELEFPNDPIPSQGDMILATGNSITIGLVIGSGGTGRVRPVDRSVSALGAAGANVSWQRLNRGSDLGTQRGSISASELTYNPDSLNRVPATGDQVGVLDGGGITHVRRITTVNHHAMVLLTTPALPASTSFSVERFPAGSALGNLSVFQATRLTLSSGSMSGAVALQLYQSGGPAIAANTQIEAGLSISGLVATRTMTGGSGANVTPLQPVIVRQGTTDAPAAVRAVERDILVDRDYTTTNTALELVKLQLSGFAYNATILAGTQQLVVQPMVNSGGTAVQADMPQFFEGELVQVAGAGFSSQYRILQIVEGTVIELEGGAALAAAPAAITVQRLVVADPQTGGSRFAISGQPQLPNTSGSTRVFRFRVWSRDAVANGDLIGIVDSNRTMPAVVQTTAYGAAASGANQVNVSIPTAPISQPQFTANEIVRVSWTDGGSNRTQDFTITTVAGAALTFSTAGAFSIQPTSTNVTITRYPRLWITFSSTPPFSSGSIDLFNISPANTQWVASFLSESDKVAILSGSTAAPAASLAASLASGTNAIIVVPLRETSLTKTGQLHPGSGKVPEDPEQWEHDRRQLLVEHELRHTCQYLTWGPMFLTLIPIWPIELTLELATDIEKPDFGPFSEATLARQAGAQTLTFSSAGHGLAVDNEVQIFQGNTNVIRKLNAPAASETGFRIQPAAELRDGAVHVRKVNSFPDWYRVAHASWLRTLTMGGLTQMAASLTHGLAFGMVGRFFYMIYRLIQMACCDDRLAGAVEGSKLKIRLSDPAKRSQLTNDERLLVQEPQSFGNATFSGISSVVRTKQAISDDGVITLSAPLPWDDGQQVNVGPYQTRTPGQIFDWNSYYPATVVVDNPAAIRLLPVGSDHLSVQPFDRLRVLAENSWFGMFGTSRTVMAVNGDVVELDQPPPSSGSAATELTLRVAKVGTEDPFDWLDTAGVDELTGGGWLRWVTDPFGQLHWQTRPQQGSFLDILARVGKYVLGTKCWSNPIIITSRYFMEAMTQALYNVSLEQDASEQSGDLYTPIGRLRGEVSVNGTSAAMTVGDIARYWYFVYEFSNAQSTQTAGIGTNAGGNTDPGLTQDAPGANLYLDQIIYSQVTAETGGGGGSVINRGAQSGALPQAPGMDVPDSFYQKNAANPNEVSVTAPDRRIIPNDFGWVPQESASLQLSSSMYLAFSRPTTGGNTHRVTVDDAIPQGANGRDAQDNNEQRLFYSLQVNDINALVSTVAVTEGSTIRLLRRQRATVRIADQGAKRYALRVLRPNNGTIVRAAQEPETVLIAQDPFPSAGGGTFSEPIEISRWHEWDADRNEYRSGGLARHGKHLPADVFVPVRKLTLQVMEFPPVLTTLPASLDFSAYPAAAGFTPPPLNQGGELFFPVAANVIIASQTLQYVTTPSPDITIRPIVSLSDVTSTSAQAVQDFLGDGLLYRLSIATDDPPEEQSSINVLFRVGETGSSTDITMTIPVQGHFLMANGGGYSINHGGLLVLTCSDLNGGAVTPNATTVQVTLADGSAVPQVAASSGGAMVNEFSFSVSGNQLTVNADGNANAALEGGIRRLLVTDSSGNVKARRTVRVV